MFKNDFFFSNRTDVSMFMYVFLLFSATRPPRHKCGLSKSCPEDHYAFKITSGAASVVGPKMCFQDNV